MYFVLIICFIPNCYFYVLNVASLKCHVVSFRIVPFFILFFIYFVYVKFFFYYLFYYVS